MTEGTNPTQGLSRRTLARGAAWTVPAVSLAAMAPQVAASGFTCSQDCLAPRSGLTIFSVPNQIGIFQVEGLPGTGTGSNVTVQGLDVLFTCDSVIGTVFGGWAVAVTGMTIFTYDSGSSPTSHSYHSALSFTPPAVGSALLSLSLSTLVNYFPDWQYDPITDFAVGQTSNHHLTKICLDLRFYYFSLGSGGLMTTCDKQYCVDTAANLLGGWNAAYLTGGSICDQTPGGC